MINEKSRYRKSAGKTEKKAPVEEPITKEIKEETLMPVEEVKETPKPKTKKKRKGYVKPTLLNVRSTPDKGNNIMCTIVKGKEVVINDSSKPGWFNISTEATSGVTVTGFVMSEFIKEV